MKKIDILNFITNYRKSPNDIKTYQQLLDLAGPAHADRLTELLNELRQLRVIRETEVNGEKAYQVTAK